MTDVETGSLLGVKSTVRTRSLARSLTPALAGSHSLARRALGATHERFNGRWLGLRADGHHLRHHRQPADGRDRRPQDGDDGAGDGIGRSDVLRARAQLHRAVDHLTYLLALWRGGAWHGCVRPFSPPPLPSSPQPSLALGPTLSVCDSVCTMCMCASTLCVAMRSQGFIRWRSRSSRHRGSDPWLSRCNTRRSTSAALCATSRLTTCACGRCENKAPFLRHFHIKTIVLPRQARDKDRETLKRRERVFRRMSC